MALSAYKLRFKKRLFFFLILLKGNDLFPWIRGFQLLYLDEMYTTYQVSLAFCKMCEFPSYFSTLMINQNTGYSMFHYEAHGYLTCKARRLQQEEYTTPILKIMYL